MYISTALWFLLMVSPYPQPPTPTWQPIPLWWTCHI